MIKVVFRKKIFNIKFKIKIIIKRKLRNKLMKKLNIIPIIKFKYKIQHKTRIFKIIK